MQNYVIKEENLKKNVISTMIRYPRKKILPTRTTREVVNSPALDSNSIFKVCSAEIRSGSTLSAMITHGVVCGPSITSHPSVGQRNSHKSSKIFQEDKGCA